MTRHDLRLLDFQIKVDKARMEPFRELQRLITKDTFDRLWAGPEVAWAARFAFFHMIEIAIDDMIGEIK